VAQEEEEGETGVLARGVLARGVLEPGEALRRGGGWSLVRRRGSVDWRGVLRGKGR
jgi:hypothetical protein